MYVHVSVLQVYACVCARTRLGEYLSALLEVSPTLPDSALRQYFYSADAIRRIISKEFRDWLSNKT